MQCVVVHEAANEELRRCDLMCSSADCCSCVSNLASVLYCSHGHPCSKVMLWTLRRCGRYSAAQCFSQQIQETTQVHSHGSSHAVSGRAHGWGTDCAIGTRVAAGTEQIRGSDNIISSCCGVRMQLRLGSFRRHVLLIHSDARWRRR